MAPLTNESVNLKIKRCCMPLNQTRRPKCTKQLQLISDGMYREVNEMLGITLRTKHVCSGCLRCLRRVMEEKRKQHYSNDQEFILNDDDENEDDNINNDVDNRIRNDFINVLNQSHSFSINKRKLKSKRYAVKKKDELVEIAVKTLFPTTPDIDLSSNDEMVEQFKDKFYTTTDDDDKYRILTSLPKSWSSRKIMSEFNVTRHMAETAKMLQNTKGIMSCPSKKKAT